MIKYLLAGLAACFTVLPATARFDSGTGDLLHLVHSYGVDVQFNTASCDGSKAGSFKVDNSIPVITLCIDPTNITADDHDTIRHEIWHLVQYCATPATSSVLHPLLKDRQKHAEFISYGLSRFTIERIRSDYRNDHHRTELEAFAAAELLSAKTISEAVVNHCH